MTREEYLQFHREFVDNMHELTKRKNADYTGKSGPFANFVRVEDLSICSTEQGFMTRIMDKISRIISFMEVGSLQVKDESVTDTLMDLANYSILLAAYLKSKKDDPFNKA